MQQFIVPQFIDVEDKIIGPITVRQFVLMLVGGLIIFLSFRLFDPITFIFITIGVGGLTLLFGFLKVNGAPFHLFVLSVLASFKKPALRVWNNKKIDESLYAPIKTVEGMDKDDTLYHKERVSQTRLAELSLVVDTRGKYKGEE